MYVNNRQSNTKKVSYSIYDALVSIKVAQDPQHVDKWADGQMKVPDECILLLAKFMKTDKF